MTTKLTKSLLVLLVLAPIVQGQSQMPEQSASALDQRTIREEGAKKASVLVEEIIDETRSLKLPESRIRIENILVALLWSRDQKRARSLFKEAVATLSELAASINPEDPESVNIAHLPGQLRQEMLQVVTSLDPQLALDFVRATRPHSADTQLHNDPAAGEAQLEMSVAIELVAKDPSEALSIGEAALKTGIDANAMNLLTRLHSKDGTIAQKYLGAMINRLRTEDFGKSGTTSYTALELLRNWIDGNRNRSVQPSGATAVSTAILDDHAAREVSRIVIKALLDNVGNAQQRFGLGRLSDVVRQMIALMPDIEKGSPAQWGELSKRMAELRRIEEAQQPWLRYQELLQTGTADALMEAARTAPPEVADNLLQNAVWRALNEGNEERAREIVERISNPRQRAEMASNLERHVLNQAGQQQDLAKARTLLSRIPQAHERAQLLAQWAMNATARGDKAAALGLIGEAQAMLVNRAPNYSQLEAQLHIAHACGQLDLGNRIAILETVIDRLNELTAAASVLSGFDLQHYFRAGEFIINGGNQLGSSVQQLSGELGSLAGVDLDRAKSLADQFHRREMRLMAWLQIVRGALAAVAEAEASAGSPPTKGAGSH